MISLTAGPARSGPRRGQEGAGGPRRLVEMSAPEVLGEGKCQRVGTILQALEAGVHSRLETGEQAVIAVDDRSPPQRDLLQQSLRPDAVSQLGELIQRHRGENPGQEADHVKYLCLQGCHLRLTDWWQGTRVAARLFGITRFPTGAGARAGGTRRPATVATDGDIAGVEALRPGLSGLGPPPVRLQKVVVGSEVCW